MLYTSAISRLRLRQFLTTLALAFVWLLVLRASFVLRSGVWPNAGTALLADLAGAALLAICLDLTRRPVARGLLIVILGCFSFSAGMHLGAHGTLPKLTLISKSADPVFLSSSVLNVHLLLLPVYLAYAWLLHRLYQSFCARPASHRRYSIAALPALILAYGLAMPSLTTPGNNLVASFLTQIPAALIAPVSTGLGEQMVAREDPPGPQDGFFHQKTLAAPAAQRPNVLLIMIEGLSAGYFPSISDYHNLEPVVTLHQLESTLEDHGFRLYRNTLSMERQTDRGTFALLCGQYPDFLRKSVKMADVAEARVSPRCMPRMLADHGYHTAYWQAAPLEYMNKDGFMPRIGFAEATGAEVFADTGEVNGWGPPDPVYFPDITRRLTVLDSRSASPWMITLLNVGTHHPFDTGVDSNNNPVTADRSPDRSGARPEDPEMAAAIDPQEARRNAMQVMSESLSRFLEELDQAGILDETLVILTSDESGGFVRRDLESTPLNNNAGMLALRPPAGDSLDAYAHRDRLVVQMDIPMTIVDVVGAGDDTATMTGRSLLAVNDHTERDLLLADTYTGLKFLLRESGQLLSCTESLLRCSTWAFDPDRLFGSLKAVDAEPFVSLDQRLLLFGQSSVVSDGTGSSANNEGE
ncbi:sulfatase-like hydrolase/transferase [uncultured Marinobacter sp.]|uniref:LTA synthase family protein n=1 Tax=uncultured Marinobacter sp. TaxID=187379 RepID=UPI0030D752E7